MVIPPVFDVQEVMVKAGIAIAKALEDTTMANTDGLDSPDDTPVTIAIKTSYPAKTLNLMETLIAPLRVNSDYSSGLKSTTVIFGTPGCG